MKKGVVFNFTVKPLLVLIAYLPFPLLYLISDGMYFFVYRLIGYRKVVVRTNLMQSFPNKSRHELKLLEKQFYKWFCDVLLETIKLYTISPTLFKKHCTISQASLDLVSDYYNKKQSYIAAMGHTGNWEWAGAAHQVYLPHHMIAVYHPLSNRGMDQFMIQLRTRFGCAVVPMQKIVRDIVNRTQNGEMIGVGLIADQTPPPESAYWMQFLNQDTPVFNGPEKMARKFNLPVIYFDMQRIKRGRYHLHLSLLVPTPKSTPEGAISNAFMKTLESSIIKNPEAWLWSHRRWKHQRKNNP
jgi:KDO2-lipid IV(A) lauroyltransferase